MRQADEGGKMTFRPEAPASQPDNRHPDYRSTVTRGPRHDPIHAAQGPTELSGPRFSSALLYHHCDDLTRQGRNGAEPQGQRIIVAGRVLDEAGQPVRGGFIEIWQANAAGRYDHPLDTHDAPLDANFTGAGRVMTGEDGSYRFTSIRPGCYPWRNHANAWRPAHIHFSVFGESMLQRLVTQMYFPGDPLLDIDPIFQSVPSAAARERLVAKFDLPLTQPEFALGYRFDIVLRGPDGTPPQA